MYCDRFQDWEVEVCGKCTGMLSKVKIVQIDADTHATTEINVDCEYEQDNCLRNSKVVRVILWLIELIITMKVSGHIF